MKSKHIKSGIGQELTEMLVPLEVCQIERCPKYMAAARRIFSAQIGSWKAQRREKYGKEIALKLSIEA